MGEEEGDVGGGGGVWGGTADDCAPSLQPHYCPLTRLALLQGSLPYGFGISRIGDHLHHLGRILV